MSTTSKSAISRWIPYNLKCRNDQYTCEWLFTGEMEYTQPFFSETISKCKTQSYYSGPYRPLSSIDMLPHWANDSDKVKPTAFIFHISRCGSTLVSQALGLNEEHVVLAEVPFIDELLRLSDNNSWPEQLDSKAIIRAAFDLYGQNRNGKKTHLFVKTDSWHIYFLPLLRELYPSTPFVLLYRRPDEVIRSQQKKRGMHAIPGLVENHILGITEPSVFDLDKHMASLIESFLRSFLQVVQTDGLTLLVNYNEGLESIVTQIAELTGITLDENDLAEVRQRGKYDAKDPDKIFAEETLTAAVPAYLQPSFMLYDELEKIKKQRTGRKKIME